MYGKGSTKHTGAKKQRAGKPASARAVFFYKAAQKTGGKPQKQNCNGKSPCCFLQGKAKFRHNGAGKYAPCINAADGNVDAYCCQCDKPSVFHDKISFTVQRRREITKQKAVRAFLSAQTAG